MDLDDGMTQVADRHDLTNAQNVVATHGSS